MKESSGETVHSMASPAEINMISYRVINPKEIQRGLFRGFIRHQTVTDCLRFEGGKWVVRSDPFIDDWSEIDYGVLLRSLKDCAEIGGLVYGAFCGGLLKGFVSVEPELFGGGNKYLDLTFIYVSEDMRHRGIGRRLFLEAKDWALKRGARKLYISAHSAVESQAFYQSMGCVDAELPNARHVEAEPYDRQLECLL